MTVGNLISLYFHFPFCHHKCPYCHFFVLRDNPLHQTQFLQALKKEWKQKKTLFQPRDLHTLYFGGGTPSRSIPLIEEVLSWQTSLPKEITVEANPEDLTEEKCAKLASLGVNRFSIGVQSFIDSELQVLKRAHNANQAIEKIHMAAGYIPNISIDLMMELPDQTLQSFTKSCEIAVQLPITHLSLYNLTIEPKTAFDRKKDQLIPRIAKEKETLQMLKNAIAIFETAGLERYEISAFCKKGYASQHNTGYWTGRPFLGLGPSAYSYWNHSRFQNVCNLAQYCKSLETGNVMLEHHEKLSFNARIFELFVIHLRLFQGVHLKQFCKRHGATFLQLKEKFEPLIQEGFLQLKKHILRLTPKGRLFYDTVAEMMIE